MDASTPDHSLVPLSPALEPPASLTTRLYVGGLPSDVTEKELKARFASFGEVHSVELVPSKLQPQANASAVDGSAAGTRRFGYVNVTPASELSLKKCFTAYNGCKWRGGRLRIEKARDDFRVRLEREREADLRAKQEEAERRLQAQRAREALLLPGGEAAGEAATPGSSSAGGGGGGGAFALPSSSSSKRKIEPLKLLWGNTKKVKVVAAAGGFGCGKHKYSFQGVPALPLSDIMAACVYVPSDPPTPPRREAHHVAASEQERSAAQKARGEAVAAKVEAWKRERERKEDKERERQEKREREQERQSAAAASSRDRFTSGVIAKILAQEEERARSQQQALLQEGLPAGAGAGAGGGEPTEEDAGEVEEVKEDEDAGAAEEAEEQDGRQVEDQGKGASRKQQVPALEEEEAAAAGVTSDSKKGKDSTKKKKKKKKKKEEKQKEKKLSEPHGGPAYLGAPSPEQEEGGAAADGPSVELVRVPGRAEAVTVAERRGSPGSHIGGGQDASGTASFEDMAGKVKVAGQGIVAGAGEDPPWTHGRSAALDHESEDGVKAGEFEEEEEDEKEQLEEEEEADGNDDDTEEEEDEVELEHASVADAVPAGEEEEEEDDDDDEDDEEEETSELPAAAAGGVQPRSPAAQEEDDIARALEEERKRHLALLGSMFPDEQHYYKEPSKKKAAPRAGFVSTLRFDPMVDAELPLCDDEGIHVSAAIEDAVVLPEEASLPVPRQPGGASLLPPSKGTRPAGALSGLRAGARGDAPEEEEVVGVGDGGSGEGRDSEDEEEGEGHEVNEEDEEEGANDGAVLEMATALPGDEHEQEEQGQEQEQEMMEQLSAKREPSAKRKRSEAVVPGAVEKAAKKRAPAVKMEEKESIWSAMFRRAGLEDVASDNEDDLEVLEAGEEEDGGEDEVDEGGGGGEEEAEGLDERMYRGPTEREGDASEAKQKKKRKKKKKKKVVQVPKSAPKVQAAADDGAGGGEGEGGVGAEELEGAELMQEGRDEEREAGAGAEAPPILARDEQQVAALTFGGGLEESAKEAPEKNLAENSSREEAGDHRNEEGKGGASLGAEPALGMPDEETVGAHEQAVVGEKPRRKKSKTRKMKAEEGAGVVHAGWEAAADTPEEREGEEAGTAIAALPEAEVTHARDVAEVPGGADASGPSVMSSEAGGAAEEAAEVAAAAEAKDAKWFQRATWKSLTDAEGRVSFSLGAILGVAAAAAAPAGAASAGPLAGEALVRPEAAAAEGSGRSSNEPQRAQEFQATLQAGELLVGGHVEAAEHSAGAHAHFAGTWLGQSAAPAATSSAPAGGQQVEEAAAGILGGLSLAMNGSGAAVLDSEECPFMRPPDAEEEWLATRGLLRQDYRRKQKAASRKGLRVKGPRPART